MTKINSLRSARYRLSVHELRQLPPDKGAELAICGRSNAGKSSAINLICDQNGLARTSKTPGRTQQLVYFELAKERHLVDLPGYGYAKVPPSLRDHWRGLIDSYFQSRECLVGLIVVMDVRHPLRDFDLQMLEYGQARGLSCHCLLTKADKLGRGAASATLLGVQKELAGRASAQLFSAHNGQGVEEARAVMSEWLRMDSAEPLAPEVSKRTR